MYGFILHAHTRSEQAEAFEQLFRAYVEPSRAEPGCVEYHMLRDAARPHLPHMRKFHDQRMDYLRRDFEIREIEMLSPASAARA
ncbi:putative quinol monooxygenase [Ectopseudomonas oleovorans]|uniref:putative quinol monooxygenase n=1 Tax=Ectopseudomonas oleovorans TaxID=301 RepID=UPI003F19568A